MNEEMNGEFWIRLIEFFNVNILVVILYYRIKGTQDFFVLFFATDVNL